MQQNHERVSRGFRSLLSAFAPYVCALLKMRYGDGWWTEAVMDRLWEGQKRYMPAGGP